MSSAIAVGIAEPNALSLEAASRFHVLRHIEDRALYLSLAGLIVLPLAEVLLRKLLRTGISGAPSLLQHLTLIAGMLGAAVAARENR